MTEAKVERTCWGSGGVGEEEGEGRAWRIRESQIFNFMEMKILQLFLKKNFKFMFRHMPYEALSSYAPCYKDSVI